MSTVNISQPLTVERIQNYTELISLNLYNIKITKNQEVPLWANF